MCRHCERGGTVRGEIEVIFICTHGDCVRQCMSLCVCERPVHGYLCCAV